MSQGCHFFSCGIDSFGKNIIRIREIFIILNGQFKLMELQIIIIKANNNKIDSNIAILLFCASVLLVSLHF